MVTTLTRGTLRMDIEDHSMVYKNKLGPYIVALYYGAHGWCMLSQATILALYREYLAEKWYKLDFQSSQAIWIGTYLVDMN